MQMEAMRMQSRGERADAALALVSSRLEAAETAAGEATAALTDLSHRHQQTQQQLQDMRVGHVKHTGVRFYFEYMFPNKQTLSLSAVLDCPTCVGKQLIFGNRIRLRHLDSALSTKNE